MFLEHAKTLGYFFKPMLVRARKQGCDISDLAFLIEVLRLGSLDDLVQGPVAEAGNMGSHFDSKCLRKWGKCCCGMAHEKTAISACCASSQTASFKNSDGLVARRAMLEEMLGDTASRNTRADNSKVDLLRKFL